MSKLEAFPFYPGDWRKDPAVQSLSYNDRGVWFEILCLMHESEERGKLLLANKAMPAEVLSRLLGLSIADLEATITNLIAYGVAYRCPATGALMNRRMVRDEYKRREELANATTSKVPAKKRRTERNELLDTLALVDGADPFQVPPRAWASYQTALSEIKAVMPTVTPDEIKTRARNYKTKHPEWALTAHALAKRWAECASFSHAPAARQEDQGPTGWFDFMQKRYPDSPLVMAGERQVKRWTDMDQATQNKIRSEMREEPIYDE